MSGLSLGQLIAHGFAKLTKAQNAALKLFLSASPAVTGPTSITANSASPALLITQDGTGNALEVRDVTSDTTPFVVDASGRVAIASSPGITGAALTIGGDASTGVQDVFRNSTDSGGFAVRMFKNRNTNVYANTIVQSGDVLGGVTFNGADGANYIQGASIQAIVDGTPGTNDMPGRLVFSTTADGASSPTERMCIDSSGNVGIGVVSKASTQVRLPIGSDVRVCISPDTSHAAGNVSKLFFGVVDGGGLGGLNVHNIHDGTYSSQEASITTANGGVVGSTERFRVYKDGKVLANNSVGLGYGTGSGGTVTQATSKSTAVTLNKPSGAITTAADALAAGANVSFAVSNTSVTGVDTVVLHRSSGGTGGVYEISVSAAYSGGFSVRIKNDSGGSLSEAIVINFSVIKGSAS